MNRRSAISTALLLSLLAGCGPDPRHSDWPASGVAVDKIGITKTLVAECCFRGYVRSIQLGNFDVDADLELAVVPQTGVYLFDAVSLKKKAQFDFKKPDGDTLWFGLSPLLIARRPGFAIAMLGGGYGDIGLMDQSGRELWNFKPDPKLPPNGMVVDDALDQEPRFYVCDRGTIYRLDLAGKVIWKVTADADYMALIRDEDSAEASIATAENRSRTLNIWSAGGQRLQQLQLPFYPDGIAFVRVGQTAGFVVKSGNQVAFLDRSGKHRFTYSYGAVPVRHGPSAVLVRFGVDQAPLLAIRSTSNSATGKSVLTMLSLDGLRLYEEYMDGGPAVGIVPVEKFTDRLLVGEGTEKLWAYEKASPNQSMQRTGASAGR